MATKFILDTRLSGDHYEMCKEAIKEGVIEPEDLNEGRRTMAEQWWFYRHQPPLAAFPSPNAPHIWAGRNNHAIDSNARNGSTVRLEHFYEARGVQVIYNAQGENWHWQPVSGSALRQAADKIRKHNDDLVWKKGEHGNAVKYFKHQLYIIHDPQTHRAYFAAGHGKPKEGWSTHFTDDLQKSVRAFQRDHKLKADGIIGPATNKAIDKAYAKAMKKRRKPAKQRAQERQAKVRQGKL